MGKSPIETVQNTDNASPKLRGSSPNENGAIFGGTWIKEIKIVTENFSFPKDLR